MHVTRVGDADGKALGYIAAQLLTVGIVIFLVFDLGWDPAAGHLIACSCDEIGAAVVTLLLYILTGGEGEVRG